jgi:hypothetical protein
MTVMLAARAHPSHEITVDKVAVPTPTPIDVGSRSHRRASPQA